MIDVSLTAQQKKMWQNTMFVGPGAIKQRIVNRKNRTHCVPLEDESIQAMTKNSNCDIVEYQCMAMK